jgi:hypothetical protein
VTPTVRSGDVLRLNEPDYLYGTGVLVLRVSKVGAVQRLRDGQGLDLEGFTLRADGTQVNTAPRQVLVRLSALRSARRQPEGNR